MTVGDISKDQAHLTVVIQDAPVSVVVSCQFSLGNMRFSMFDYQTIQLALETYVKVGIDIRMRPQSLNQSLDVSILCMSQISSGTLLKNEDTIKSICGDNRQLDVHGRDESIDQ